MKKKISDFLSKHFLFLEMKISIYLNRRVFIMISDHAEAVVLYGTLWLLTVGF